MTKITNKIFIFLILITFYPTYIFSKHEPKKNTNMINTSTLNDNSQKPIKKLKIISLNIWGGYVKAPLLEFMQTYQDIDIFCLQEVYNNAPYKISADDKILSLNIFDEILSYLPNHKGYFTPVVGKTYGIAIFIKKDLKVMDKGDVLIHESLYYPGRGPTHSRKLQWLKLLLNEKEYNIINLHGLWNGKGKTDSPERMLQSEVIKKFLDSANTPFILCGDFNLRPDTSSIKLLEHNANNLIKDYHVTSTRTSLYDKEEKFADYIFISPVLDVKNFEVLQDVVSDHAPLLVEIDLLK